MPADDPRFADVRRLGGEEYAAWLAAGYREYYSGPGKSTPYLLQRRIRGDDGATTYFVNVWAYDWSGFESWTGSPVIFLAEVQFNTRGDAGRTFNVEMLRPGDPATTEAFFLRIYRSMECRPYGD